jgi:hypothetical protein
MKKYTDEQLEKNYNKFISVVKKYISGDRLEKLLHMYSLDELGPNLMLSPASGNKHFHNAYEGGYIDHVFNVCKNALRMKQTFVDAGAEIDFTDEELLFSALHHDLGKLGTKGKMHYIPNDSDWHIKNRGEYYKRNSENVYMTLTDRTFFLLNHYGIQYNEKEYFGIKLTDGMYDDDNQKYLKTYQDIDTIKTPMYHILHFADSMSSFIERDILLKEELKK